MKLTDQLLALLVVAIWGTNFVFIRVGLDELEPFTFATLRFALVAIPLVFFIPRPKVAWPLLIAYGLFIGVGQFGLLFWAMRDDIAPGLASLVVQMQVFFTVLLSATLLGERVTLTQFISLLICLLGLAIIIVFTDAHTTYIGLGLVLTAGLSWSLGNLVVKRAGRVDILPFMVWSSLFAVPPLLVIALISEGSTQFISQTSTLSWQGWLVVIWQSIGNTMIGYGLWNWLLGRYSAASVAPWALMVPVFGMSASALILVEPMPWWKLIAAGLILLGLTINMLSGRNSQ